eukprot:CAMPEP_0176259006 /NCGR_PEP_ID=MMETSP0121_2-20121125/38853_1 /TAXON_ID=160619 /ORGANISM="Kryptoperidinium foliaceum, Strain CCMP 1326" /LENGTH=123 /DNA_ID=CAMNT_0017598889 /DNA_START=62 /DNA_END=431 /DNA_ORIENTATION=+
MKVLCQRVPGTPRVPQLGRRAFVGLLAWERFGGRLPLGLRKRSIDDLEAVCELISSASQLVVLGGASPKAPHSPPRRFSVLECRPVATADATRILLQRRETREAGALRLEGARERNRRRSHEG